MRQMVFLCTTQSVSLLRCWFHVFYAEFLVLETFFEDGGHMCGQGFQKNVIFRVFFAVNGDNRELTHHTAGWVLRETS